MKSLSYLLNGKLAFCLFLIQPLFKTQASFQSMFLFISRLGGERRSILVY